jgi:hypothetical protein
LPKYHVPNEAARRALDEHWAERLRGNGEERAAFERAVGEFSAVTAGLGGSHFQRDRREPGTHPLARRRFFALPGACGEHTRPRRPPAAALRSGRSLR